MTLSARALRGGRSRIVAAPVVAVLAAVTVPCWSSAPAGAASGTGGTLVIAMTAGAIPPLDTDLAGSQGYEGYRFVGNQLYDGLTKFTLTSTKKIPAVVGDLATTWTSSTTSTVWTFKLRKGVTFADGTPFNATAVVFDLQRDFTSSFQYYDPEVGALASTLAPLASWKAIGTTTVQLTTKNPDSHFPSDMTTLYFASPTAVQKYGNTGFATHPVGTGPFVFESETQGQELILGPNKNYWAGAPKLSELVLKPMPTAASRIAALRSGQVNWIEYPTPDDLTSLKAAGFTIYENTYTHIWPWIFDTQDKPWTTLKVRQAAEYAINRDAMATDLLHGSATAANGLIPSANAAYSKKAFAYSYNPKKAKALLKAAGYLHGVTVTLSYPTSGSGNMVPGPMNEELQQTLAAVGIHVKLEPMEWSTMLTQFETGQVPDTASATNISLTFQQEDIWGALFSGKSPLDLDHFTTPTLTALIGKVQTTSTTAARSKLYGQIGTIVTKNALWLFVVNDKNPRATASTVHGVIEPKSWFITLRSVWVS